MHMHVYISMGGSLRWACMHMEYFLCWQHQLHMFVGHLNIKAPAEDSAEFMCRPQLIDLHVCQINSSINKPYRPCSMPNEHLCLP